MFYIIYIMRIPSGWKCSVLDVENLNILEGQIFQVSDHEAKLRRLVLVDDNGNHSCGLLLEERLEC